MEETETAEGHTPRGQVPRQALLLSLISLWIPILSSSVFPEWTHEDVGILIWLLALVPAFLLSFYKGWRGASVALAAGMAAFSVAQVIVVATDATLPDTELLLGVAAVFLAVGLGSGWASSLLRRSVKSAEKMALTDPGTGLPNRRHALDHLERTFEAARRGGRMAVGIFDLDRFKQINDQHGHATGDEVLREFASILRTRTRAMDLPARFGGEEFLTILQDCDVQGALRYAETVRKALAERSFPFGEVTVSAGVAEYQIGMTSPEVLVAAADQALYRAKEEGRNRVYMAGDGQLAAGEGQPAGHATVGGGEPAHAAEPEDEPRGRGELILVVDHDQATLNSIGKALRRLGYEVLLASDPGNAVEIFLGLEQPVHLVLANLILPPTSGFRLVERISARQNELRVVYMSQQLDEEGWADAPGTVRGFLEKPFSRSVLARKVRRVLDVPLDDGEEPDPDAADAGDTEASRTPPEVGAKGAGSEVVAVLGPTSRQARALAFRLKHLGYHDAWISDVEDLAESRGLAPDLVLVQVTGSGDRPMAWLRDIRTAVDPRHTGFPPILALVEGDWPELQWQLQHLGALDHLREPYELEELGARIANLLQLQRAFRTEHKSRARLEARLAARTAELEAARTDVLLRLARAAEFRDDRTGAHTQRVGILSRLIARELNQERAWCEILENAAPLHDLGKIAIPDGVLNKPGSLSPAEREIMERHTIIGSELLSGSRDPMIQSAEEIALSHHEAWDGSGYPSGLAGEAIPLSGRIVALADTFDSMRHSRPFREATGLEESLEYIRECRGTRFDPQVVDAFLRMVRSGGLEALEDLEVVAGGAPSTVAPG